MTDDPEPTDDELEALEAAAVDTEDDEGDGVDRDPTKTPILDTMRELGPCTAAEIANTLHRTTGNVHTRLRQYEEAGKVRRTGRSAPAQPGQRGPSGILWELMPENGTPTGPGDEVVTAPAASAEGRIRALSERVGSLATELERAQGERDAAKAGAADARRELQEERARRERDSRAESDTVATLMRQRSDLEREVERMRTELDAHAEDVQVAAAESNSMAQSELDDLAELLGLPNADDHGAVRDRVREIIRANVEGARDRAAAALDDPVTVLPRLLPMMGDERRRYFDFLMELAAGSRDEHVFDRIERLLEGGTYGGE